MGQLPSRSVSFEPPAEPATRVCYRHPERETRLSCSQCGRPICGSCSIDAAVGQRCPQCVGQEGRQQTIRVQRPPRRASALPPVTKWIMVLTVAMTVLGSPGGRYLIHNSTLVEAGQWWRMFPTALLHGRIAHLVLNMWALYVLGPQVERGV